MFVANCVQQIRNHSEPSQWRHIVSSENPADMASRGVTVQDLLNRSVWLSGPEFLWKNTDLESHELPLNDPEVKKA